MNTTIGARASLAAWLLTCVGALAACAPNRMLDETSSEAAPSSGANDGAGDDDDADAGASVEGNDPGDPVPIVAAPPTSVAGASALLAEVKAILAALKTTHYQHTSNIDASKGIFDTDCSGFVNYALAVGVSDAYDVLESATLQRPVAESYVTFIDGLVKPKGRWNKVTQVAKLVPGDIVAWRIPAGVKSSDTGHVMIVEAPPVIAANQADVAIVDSTETGHGDADPRLPKGPNGIGRGTMVLMMNSDGTASGYRWSMDSDSAAFVTTVVMAHLE